MEMQDFMQACSRSYRSISLLTAHLLQWRTSCLSGFSLFPPSPIALFLVPQVWYLSGWVCYLQMENPREQHEGDERTRSEENEEERRALWEAARSYLTNAKKVIQRKWKDCSRSRLGWQTFPPAAASCNLYNFVFILDDCKSSPQQAF